MGPHRHLDSRHREEGLGNPRVWTDRSSWDRGGRPLSATGTGRRPGHHNSAGGTPCRGSLRKRRRTRTRECDRQQPGGVAAQCAARERATGKGLATHSSTNSAAILLPQYLSCAHGARGTCPSGWLLGFCSHCLSTCPRARRSTSARATDCAGKRAFGNRVAAWPKLAPDQYFGYI